MRRLIGATLSCGLTVVIFHEAAELWSSSPGPIPYWMRMDSRQGHHFGQVFGAGVSVLSGEKLCKKRSSDVFVTLY
jgi:hypothetical protein